MADKHRNRAFGHGRFAVAELGGHIDLDGDTCDLFEPVFRHQTGIKRRAAGHHRQALDLCKIQRRGGQGHIGAIAADVMRQGTLQHGRLLGDLLGHKMLVSAFVSRTCINLDHFHRTVGLLARGIANVQRSAGQHRHIALFKIGDLVGHRGQCNRIGADKHFAVSVTNRQW